MFLWILYVTSYETPSLTTPLTFLSPYQAALFFFIAKNACNSPSVSDTATDTLHGGDFGSHLETHSVACLVCSRCSGILLHTGWTRGKSLGLGETQQLCLFRASVFPSAQWTWVS